MGFRQGSFCKIWKLENKGNYHVAEISTSKKMKDKSGKEIVENGKTKYETDWSNKFVRLVGTSHSQAESMDTSKNVKIGACEVTNKWDKEKGIMYTNYVIFAFEDSENNGNTGNSKPVQAKPTAPTGGFYPVNESIADDDLPF